MNNWPIQSILTLAITVIGSLFASVLAIFIIEWIREKLKKRVSLKTCIAKAKSACLIIEKDFSPTLIWGFRRNGGGMARLIAPMFSNGKEIGVITSNTKNAVIKKINFNQNEKNQKIVVIIGKKFEDNELALLKDIKSEISKIENSEVKICSLVRRTEQAKQTIKQRINKEIDYTFFDDEKYQRSSFPWDFDNEKTVKRRKRKMVITCTIAGIILLILSIVKITVSDKIKIGIAPFDVESAVSLKSLYEQNLTSYANDYMSIGRPVPTFRFEIEVNQTQDYNDVLADVKNNKTQIAFLSSYLCAKQRISAKTNSIEIIGQMREGYSDTYKSWLVARRDCFENGKDIKIDNILSGIGKGQITVCLNEIRESGSTHVVPKIFLLESGINPFIEDSCKVVYMQKKDMIQYLSKHRNSIGFISSSEYLKQFMRKDTSEWFVYPLEYPIPRDIVVANSDWWDKMKTKEKQQQILDALSKGDIKCVPEINDGKRANFKCYVGSGVLYDKENRFVSIMTKGYNPLKLDSIWNNKRNLKVVLVKFSVFDNNARIDTVGEGRIDISSSNPSLYRYKLDSVMMKGNNVLSRGLHVLEKKQ